jgi:hypothetical protein
LQKHGVVSRGQRLVVASQHHEILHDAVEVLCFLRDGGRRFAASRLRHRGVDEQLGATVDGRDGRPKLVRYDTRECLAQVRAAPDQRHVARHHERLRPTRPHKVAADGIRADLDPAVLLPVPEPGDDGRRRSFEGQALVRGELEAGQHVPGRPDRGPAEHILDPALGQRDVAVGIEYQDSVTARGAMTAQIVRPSVH